MAYATIDNPELYFQTKTYSGTGSSLAVTLDGSEDMQPDLVWVKSRSHTNYHICDEKYEQGHCPNFVQSIYEHL